MDSCTSTEDLVEPSTTVSSAPVVPSKAPSVDKELKNEETQTHIEQNKKLAVTSKNNKSYNLDQFIKVYLSDDLKRGNFGNLRNKLMNMVQALDTYTMNATPTAYRIYMPDNKKTDNGLIKSTLNHRLLLDDDDDDEQEEYAEHKRNEKVSSFLLLF